MEWSKVYYMCGIFFCGMSIISDNIISLYSLFYLMLLMYILSIISMISEYKYKKSLDEVNEHD